MVGEKVAREGCACGPQSLLLDSGLDRVGVVRLVEEVTRTGALDLRCIWGLGKRLPLGCPPPLWGTAITRDSPAWLGREKANV